MQAKQNKTKQNVPQMLPSSLKVHAELGGIRTGRFTLAVAAQAAIFKASGDTIATSWANSEFSGRSKALAAVERQYGRSCAT